MFTRQHRYDNPKAGRLNTPVNIYAPVREATNSAGVRQSFALWHTTRAMLDNIRGSEVTEGEMPTAKNTRMFTVRAGAVENINETMVISADLLNAIEYYNIERIDRLEEGGRTNQQWAQITATRRLQVFNVVAPVNPGNGEVLGLHFFQAFAGVNGGEVTVTNGTIVSTPSSYINQLLFVFRSGLRLVYGQSGDSGFTINTAANKIVFNSKLRGENVIVHQYRIV